MNELQNEKLKHAERKLVQSLAAALAVYDAEARKFTAQTGIGLPVEDDGCLCPPCEFLRSCRAIVGAFEDEHGVL